jgi:protein SCO1/2
MDAMAMPFDLKGSARTATLTPGDRVQFRLSVKKGQSWVDRVEVVSAAPVDAGLQQTPVAPVLVPVGSAMPDFELTDQNGSPVVLSALKGKVVAVTFIYSRCPLPDYCPRMVENFRAIRQRFTARMDRDLVLLTISFDPRYDTPEVLTRYAASQRAGGPGWHFLTGDPAKIERVCNAFGIQYWAEEGLITHSLQTAVIDREGRLAATVEGKNFTPEQLGDLVGSVLDPK